MKERSNSIITLLNKHEEEYQWSVRKKSWKRQTLPCYPIRKRNPRHRRGGGSEAADLQLQLHCEGEAILYCKFVIVKELTQATPKTLNFLIFILLPSLAFPSLRPVFLCLVNRGVFVICIVWSVVDADLFA